MYHIASPHPALAPYIDCYWFIAPGVDAALNERIFVDGKADIVFNFGCAYQRTNRAGVPETLAASNLDAQRTHPVVIAQQGGIALVGVRFRAGGLYAFLPASQQTLTNQIIEVHAAFGGTVRALEGKLYDVRPDTASARALLDEFFLAGLQTGAANTPTYRLTRHVAGLIEARGGVVDIARLGGEVGYSPRNLSRLFSQHFGLSPKYYARAVRLQRALGMLVERPAASLLHIALACGYYDQAHFTKDFTTLAGQSPERYRAEVLARLAPQPPPNLSDIYNMVSPLSDTLVP
jgi:AraC-like DNA-binding protein